VHGFPERSLTGRHAVGLDALDREFLDDRLELRPAYERTLLTERPRSGRIVQHRNDILGGPEGLNISLL